MQRNALAPVIAGAIDFAAKCCEQSPAMRHLIAILGVLAMLVSLAGPVAVLAAAPCAAMEMAVEGEQGHCEAGKMTCVAPCLAAGGCQSQCGPATPVLLAGIDNGLVALAVANIPPADELVLSGTASPVDGPPPRI